jgi:hypothetical protein
VSATSEGLRRAADLLDSLPGLPQVYVTVLGNHLTVLVHAEATGEAVRIGYVDALLSLLDGHAVYDRRVRDDGTCHYGGAGWLGKFRVDVFTAHVVMPGAEVTAS